MADKLALYNEALGHLQEGAIRSLTENREPRRVLDTFWSGAVAYCLERYLWNFAYRTVSIDASTTIAPAFGYLFAFKIPDDWIRTRRLSATPTFMPPLLQVAEEAGYWYANVSTLYVQYNSSDPLYGMDLGKWPATFADFVALRLARQAAPRIPAKAELLAGPDGLIKREEKAAKVAGAICAMNEAVGTLPTSGWVGARRGFAPNMPGPGGDEPTGGGLVP